MKNEDKKELPKRSVVNRSRTCNRCHETDLSCTCWPDLATAFYNKEPERHKQ